MRIAWKLFRRRKDGSLGSLFINRRARIPLGEWLSAKNYPTAGYTERPGWHCTSSPDAPHLSTKGRVWAKVRIDDYTSLDRPLHQGGRWYLAKRMKVLEVVNGRQD